MPTRIAVHHAILQFFGPEREWYLSKLERAIGQCFPIHEDGRGEVVYEPGEFVPFRNIQYVLVRDFEQASFIFIDKKIADYPFTWE